MRILITGVSGFVGKHLRASLEQKGHKVYGFDRTPSDVPNEFCGDIADVAVVSKAVAACSPDQIFHLAGFSSVKESFSGEQEAFRVNVEGTRAVLEAAKKMNPPPRVLVVSSSEVYGQPTRNPVQEGDSLSPLTPYGRSRVAQEAVIQEFPDLPVIISRSFNHTGPGQPPVAVVPSFARQIAEIEIEKRPPLLAVGNLAAVRDFSDVRDIVQAYAALIEKGTPHEVYNVGSGEGISIDEVLQRMLALSPIGASIVIERTVTEQRAADVSAIYADITKFSALTGTFSRIPLSQTLADTLDYWRNETRHV